MSRATADDQLRFLLSCVKHSNNGKIDFIEVARECDIVSKGAAAKRYERLMKANGIHPTSDAPKSNAVPKEKSTAAIAKAAALKRRKIEGDHYDIKQDDSEDTKSIMPKLEDRDTYITPKAEPGLGYYGYSHPTTSTGMSHPYDYAQTVLDPVMASNGTYFAYTDNLHSFHQYPQSSGNQQSATQSTPRISQMNGVWKTEDEVALPQPFSTEVSQGYAFSQQPLSYNQSPLSTLFKSQQDSPENFSSSILPDSRIYAADPASLHQPSPLLGTTALVPLSPQETVPETGNSEKSSSRNSPAIEFNPKLEPGSRSYILQPSDTKIKAEHEPRTQKVQNLPAGFSPDQPSKLIDNNIPVKNFIVID